MKTINTVLLSIAALTCCLQAATITAFTANQGGSTISFPSGDDVVTNQSILLDFTTGGVTYSNLIFADATTPVAAAATTYWGVGTTDPSGGDETVFLTDNRLDTGITAVAALAEFEFASAPTSLNDVIFMFDVSSPETGLGITLIDSANNTLGNEFSLTLVDTGEDINVNRGSGSGGQISWAVNATAVTMSDFGITEGQLSSVDGYRFTSGSGIDLMVTGFASVPEPTSIAMVGLAGMMLLLRRRRQP